MPFEGRSFFISGRKSKAKSVPESALISLDNTINKVSIFTQLNAERRQKRRHV